MKPPGTDVERTWYDPIEGATGRVGRGVQHADVMPTVLEVLGLPVPPSVQGSSLLSAGERYLLAVQYPRELTIRLRDEFDRTQWTLYSDELKLIEYPDGQRELYDLSRDPGELRDLGRSHATEAATLSSVLAALRAAIPKLGPRRAESPEVDEETLRKLRSLGYAQ